MKGLFFSILSLWIFYLIIYGVIVITISLTTWFSLSMELLEAMKTTL